MGNYKLVFGGTEASNTLDHELTCFINANNELFIEILGDTQSYICLDRATAIKFHRELKKQISFIRDEEVNNG